MVFQLVHTLSISLATSFFSTSVKLQRHIGKVEQLLALAKGESHILGILRLIFKSTVPPIFIMMVSNAVCYQTTLIVTYKISHVVICKLECSSE